MLGLCVFCAVVVVAAPRRHYSDAQIVSRAELIVVGRVKEGSVKLTRLTDNSWEQRADLLISEVLKGQTSATSLVVQIEGQLRPVVGGYSDWNGVIIDLRGRAGTNYPKDIVEIAYTGTTQGDTDSLDGDLRTNHVWLLRSEEQPGRGKMDRLSIFDPEDIQQINRKEELLRVLKSLPATGQK